MFKCQISNENLCLSLACCIFLFGGFVVMLLCKYLSVLEFR